jgi:hypothetical protein
MTMVPLIFLAQRNGSDRATVHLDFLATLYSPSVARLP